jgi:hypothetical protein
MAVYTIHKTGMIEMVIRPGFSIMAAAAKIPVVVRGGLARVARHAIWIIGVIKSIVTPTGSVMAAAAVFTIMPRRRIVKVTGRALINRIA